MHAIRGWEWAGLALCCALPGQAACNAGDAADGTATIATTGSPGDTGGPASTGDTGVTPTGTDDTGPASPTTTTAPSTTDIPDPSTGATAHTTDGPSTGETGDTGGALATCDDGEKNQDETAVDCGGACSPCPDGAACFVADDCAAAQCDDLVCGRKVHGTWGLGLIGNKMAYANFVPAINGHHFRWAWADWQPTVDSFDSDYLLGDVTTVVDDGLYVGFMMIVAPTSNGTTPDWLFMAPDNVPLVTTSTMQTFPYYFHPKYQQRYFAMLDALRAEVAGWDPDLRDAVLFWQSAEGSTGDEGTYKGDPPPQYEIPDDEWTAFKRDEVWTPMFADLAADLPSVRLMINQGNDGENFQWALDNLPGAWLKAGQFTHYYNFAGEGHYAERLQALRDDPPGEHRVRGENEGTLANPWWMESPAKNYFALACSCLHAGVDILNVSPANAMTDHAAYLFFNRYAGIRRAEDGNVGFAALRDTIDLADLDRFPEGDEYGPLVAMADLATYNNRVDQIENSGDPPALQESRLTSLLTAGKMGQPFLSSERIAKIRALFPGAGYTSLADNAVDAYNMDFGVHMIPGNYSLFVSQREPHTTSVGVYRQGPKNDMFGRFGRRTAATDGKDRMTFAVDPGLLGDHTYRVRITVTTHDQGAGEWSLRYWDGDAEQTADTVTNTDTNTSRQHVFDIDALAAGGHLPLAGDFALQHESGPDTTFFLVEVERRARLD